MDTATTLHYFRSFIQGGGARMLTCPPTLFSHKRGMCLYGHVIGMGQLAQQQSQKKEEKKQNGNPK